MKVTAGGRDTVGDMQRVVQSIPASYTIWKDGTQAIAESNVKGGTDYTTGTDAEVIQAAFGTGNRQVSFREGVYEVPTTITGVENLILDAESRGDFRNTTAGVVFKFTGATGAVFDFSDIRYWEAHNIKIRGEDAATIGIKAGGALLANRGKHLVLENVIIQHINGTGLQLGDSTALGNVDDSAFTNLVIQNCTTGVSYAHTANKFIGGAITDCAVGFLIFTASQCDFQGIIFSANGIDLEIIGDDAVSPYGFFGCWFEAATDTILKRPNVPATTKVVSPFNFYSCNLHVAAGANALFNMTNISGRVLIHGGRIDNSGKTNCILGETISLLSVDDATSREYLTFSGNGSGIVQGVLKRRITYNGGTQAIGTLPVNAMVTRVWAFTETLFDGDTVIDIGDPATHAGFLTDGNIDKTHYVVSGDDDDEGGVYLWDSVNKHHICKSYLDTPVTINGYVTSTTGTAGVLCVYVEFKEIVRDLP